MPAKPQVLNAKFVNGKRPSRDQLKAALLLLALRSGIPVRLKVFGTSMLPSLWPGDILTIERATLSSVALGDILLVVRRGRFRIHRLVDFADRSGSTVLILRGDGMPWNDPPLSASELVGRVCRVERKNRHIIPTRHVPARSRLAGWALWRLRSLRNLTLRASSLVG